MTATRLYVFCEGQTEEAFVNAVLGPHFAGRGAAVVPLLLPNKAGSTSREHKGGWVSYGKARRVIRQAMQHHSDATWFTSMLDLYATPDDFPGLATAPHEPAARVRHLEQAFQEDVCTDALWRFTPYLQLHEFEALLLADPVQLGVFFPDKQKSIGALQADIAGLEPEAVNGGLNTAPSKRIIRFLPGYEGSKVAAGPQITKTIGLPTLRARCPHFGAWLAELERRTAPAP